MLLKKWDELPDFMKNDEVKRYYDMVSKKRMTLFLKRMFDIVMSFLLLIILSPLFLVLSIWIKCDSSGPVFYRQERITQYGKVFRIYKFRTMVMNADKIGSLVTTVNDERITRVGRKIRKYRLDEIPQLMNVFMGEMSFVGTRPEVKKYVDAYSDEMKATLLLPAGVTSLASIQYRDEDEMIGEHKGKTNSDVDTIYLKEVLSSKMILNLQYVEKINVFLDIKICLMTLWS